MQLGFANPEFCHFVPLTFLDATSGPSSLPSGIVALLNQHVLLMTSDDNVDSSGISTSDKYRHSLASCRETSLAVRLTMENVCDCE